MLLDYGLADSLSANKQIQGQRPCICLLLNDSNPRRGFDKIVGNNFEQRSKATLAPKGWSTWMYGIILSLRQIKERT